ncbi:MAG: hypothetical protein ACYS5V_06710, partial [Planctomycetota bacterium]
RWRSDRKPIEFNGIEPDVEVEADPVEVAKGMNSAICRAREYLQKQAKRRAGFGRPPATIHTQTVETKGVAR